MEYRIGQVFEVKGKWYQFVEVNGTCCNNCVFNQGLRCMYPDISTQCARFFRTDGKNGHVVLLGAIGGEYKQGNAIFRDYRCQTKPVTTDKRVYINNSDSDISLIISIKIHDLVEKFEQNKENMEEKKPTYEELLHYYHSTVGLWAIDKNPQEVSLDWIRDNTFRLGIDEKHSNSENIGKNLKEFNLEAAKSGKPVCTRDGRKARIICFYRVTNSTNEYTGHLIVLVTNPNGDEQSFYYTEKGNLAGGDEYDNHKWDLMMLPEKKEGWVNVSKFSTYASKEEALSHRTYDIIDTIKVSWEE